MVYITFCVTFKFRVLRVWWFNRLPAKREVLGSKPGSGKSCNIIFAVSYGQTHAIIHRVKHTVQIKLFLSGIFLYRFVVSILGIMVRASARESGGSGSNPDRKKFYYLRVWWFNR